jgi:hypothetical protein
LLRFWLFCWPPHLSPGRAAAAEESPRETRLGPLSEPLFAAFSRDFTRNGRFLRPFPGILREMSGPPRSSVTRRPGAPRQKTGGRPDHRFWSQKCAFVHRYAGLALFARFLRAFPGILRFLRLFAGRPTCHLGGQRPLSQAASAGHVALLFALLVVRIMVPGGEGGGGGVSPLVSPPQTPPL